jgi:hypothetical protein
MEMPWAVGGGILLLVIVVFLIVLAVLGILMPFFVFRIRNEMIALNGQVESAKKLLIIQSEQLDSIIQVLKTQAKILLKQATQ